MYLKRRAFFDVLSNNLSMWHISIFFLNVVHNLHYPIVLFEAYTQ